MKEKLVYFVVYLTLIISINSCLKYKDLSDVNGLGLEVQGATPLFSYTLTMQDLLFKIIRSDSSNLSVNPVNRVYQWTEKINEVNAVNSSNDSLCKNVSVGNFVGIDSVGYGNMGIADVGEIITALVDVGKKYRYGFPQKQANMKMDASSINIIKLNNISGKLVVKITNMYDSFPVSYTIKFVDLIIWNTGTSRYDSLFVIKHGWLAPKQDTMHVIDIIGGQWNGIQSNFIKYIINDTIFNTNPLLPTIDIKKQTDLQNGKMKVEDTFIIKSYDAIFGDVGSNRYLFTDNISQKINITDPFILEPNNNSQFPQIGLQIDYKNHSLGIDAKAVLLNVKFKMKDGTEKPLLFFNQFTGVYSEDSLLFPLGVDRMTTFNGPSIPAPSVTLDTSNTNFQVLNLNLREVDSLLYKVKFYSLKNTSEDTNSFIRQPSTPNFVNSASGKFIIPYVLSSKIFIDTSKTSVINIPEKFYTNVDNIIKNKNGTGELQEIELSMTVENNTIFSIIPQVYFTNNSQIIDSFSIKERIPAAILSPDGLIRLPNSLTITKKFNAIQWEQLKQCNRLMSSMFLETSSEVKYPSITTEMYVKFYFKVGNIGFKYLIKK